jgi:putative endonuclease
VRSRPALGRVAEEAACDYLVARGFSILARNLRLGPLELDIVAKDAATLAIVEVRARKKGALVGALASVGATKRTRLLSAARRLLVDAPVSLEGITFVRIDVVVVHVEGAVTRVEHFRGAITEEPASEPF